MSRILLHICCAPCTIYPLSALRADGIAVHGFFYNPHIQPWQEFDRRLTTLESYAEGEQLPLIVRPDYDPLTFFRQVAFRETSRCIYCYSLRLDAAASLAKKSRFDAFSTTLLHSRHQKHDLVISLAREASLKHSIPFHYRDFREGWKEGQEKARSLGIYRQQYCGCVYSEMERFCGGTSTVKAKKNRPVQKRPTGRRTPPQGDFEMPGPDCASERDDKQLRPCGIFIDAEGEWYHGENRIVRPEILELLYDRLDLAPGGGFVLADPKGKCLLETADTPFVVSRVDMENRGAAEECILLVLKHLAGREILDPRTLFVGPENVLYCRVRDGRFQARFSRPAYYQIAEFIEETADGDFCIEIGGIKYPVSNEGRR